MNRKTPCAESLVHTYARKLNDIWPCGIDSVRASDGPQGCECGNGINDRLSASVKVAIVISSEGLRKPRSTRSSQVSSSYTQEQERQCTGDEGSANLQSTMMLRGRTTNNTRNNRPTCEVVDGQYLTVSRKAPDWDMSLSHAKTNTTPPTSLRPRQTARRGRSPT